MTTFLLVRHAAHDNVGTFLAGRAPGVTLGDAGRQQASRLATRLRGERIARIYTSPLERTRQTADAIASANALQSPELAAELNEVDFGAWTGKDFEQLKGDANFRHWNEARSLARTPAGEGMLDVQLRVVRFMEKIAQGAGACTVALVSHADVIKAAVSYYLGLPIDAWARFEISPASISTLVLADHTAKLTGLNEVVW